MSRGQIDLENLVKRYGDVLAVDDVDLHMPGGEFFTLLGPSGCGKTSTLRLIAGFEKLDSGAIKLDGVDMSAKPPHKRPVNTVFQSYALFPHMTVAENVAFGLRYQRCTKAEQARRVGEAMEMVQLERASRAAARLSSPGVNSNGWLWRARSCWSHPSCCSTSRSARSTRACAWTSRSSSSGSRRRSGSRSSTSRTTRTRR